MKTCKNCKHCKIFIDGTNMVSPGGMMFITNYKCYNNKSESFNEKMNVIMHTMIAQKIDSRENRSCDMFEVTSPY